MATLLLLLLVSAGPCVGDYFNTHLQEVCDGYTRPDTIMQLTQCSEPPCNTTTTNLTLALPLLLSLDSGLNNWATSLELYNTTGNGCGLVELLWNWRKTPNIVLMKGATCDSPQTIASVQHSAASGVGEQMHFEVVTKGKLVKLYLQDRKGTPLTLTCEGNLSPYLVVVPVDSTYGYSALTALTTTTTIPTTTTSTTTTTTTTTPMTTYASTTSSTTTNTTTTTTQACIPATTSIAIFVTLAILVVVVAVVVWYITKTCCIPQYILGNTGNSTK